MASRKHGGWDLVHGIIQCTECGYGTYRSGWHFMRGECFSANDGKFIPRYCPMCGAVMDAPPKPIRRVELVGDRLVTFTEFNSFC